MTYQEAQSLQVGQEVTTKNDITGKIISKNEFRPYKGGRLISLKIETDGGIIKRNHKELESNK